MNDAIKLIGIVIVVIGFVMKFDTLATVVVAGLVTGLISGMSIMDILNTLGTAFLTNRTATLFISLNLRKLLLLVILFSEYTITIFVICFLK